jgi:hypothetical protein
MKLRTPIFLALFLLSLPLSAASDLIVSVSPGPTRTATRGIVGLESETPDDNPVDYSVTRTFDVLQATNFFVETIATATRVDPGTVVSTRTILSNFLDSRPTDVHLKFVVANGSVAAVHSDDTWSCTFSGAEAECVAATLNDDCRCGAPIEVAVRTSSERGGGVTELIATASSALPELEPGSQHHGDAVIQTYRVVPVTSVFVDGPGSLRQAILEANQSCGTLPCKIAFEIATPVPAAGYFAIVPSYALPPITAARVSVDGKRQTAFSGDTNPSGPEVALDGHLTAVGRGLEIHSRCEAIVQGLAIGNFPDHGLVFASDGTCFDNSGDQRLIAANYVGVEPTGRAAWPNFRGVYVAGYATFRDNVISGNVRSGVWAQEGNIGLYTNRIGVTADGSEPLPNGASGLYLAANVETAEVLKNTISYNREMGVAVAPSAGLIDIRQNSMRQNGGLGIDIGLDGKNAPLQDDRGAPSNSPVILSARYDAAANATIVTATLTTGPLGPYANAIQLDVYANDQPDGDGELWIAQRYGVSDSNGTYTLTIGGDYRGKWVNATSTRVHFLAKRPRAGALSRERTPQSIAGGQAKTSELSNSVLVQ